MANTNINLVGLDFNTLKDNLKSFLKNNTQFKDLDYEGSNINVLLDVLAYNTYLNGFYTNMVASEMFLDTAQLRDSVVSHAKELNYVPRSFNAAQAEITVAITPSSAVSSVLIPQYTSFTSRSGSNTYTFTTNDTVVLTTSNNGVFTANVSVYEGSIASETFIINSSNTAQRYVLSNPTIDTSNMTVTLYEDGGQNVYPYTKTEQLFNIDSTSKVFFIQAAQNQQYEIVFGDGVYGRKPKDGSSAVVKYRTTSGELSNGCYVFTSDGAIDGHPNVTVTTISAAAGGAIAETINSIKFNAPRSFQAQDRAVTVRDYETLLTNQFADIQAIGVYGGEEADPPQFGRVFISVDVYNADGAPESRKKTFYDYLKDKTPLTITPVFVDPEFMYVKVTTSVKFDINSTTKSTADILTAVQGAISGYSLNNLENFKKTLYYSALSKQIDSADSSIIGNDTDLYAIKRIIPITNTDYSIIIQTHNELETEVGPIVGAGEIHYGHAFKTSTFTYLGSKCLLVDDTLGTVFIAAQDGNYIQILNKVGTINYVMGKVTIIGLNISAYEGNYIECQFKTKSKNITGYKNVILEIAPQDVAVSVTGVKL
jgi:hypothetical protein